MSEREAAADERLRFLSSPLLFLVGFSLLFIEPNWLFPFGVPKVILSFLTAAVLYALLPFLRPNKSQSGLTLLVFLFLIVTLSGNISGATWIASFYGSFYRQDGWYVWVLAFLLFYFFSRYGGLFERKLIPALTLFTLIVSIYAIIQKLGLDPVIWDRKDPRTFSFFGHGAALSAILLLSLPYLLRLPGFRLTLMLGLTALYLSKTRAALLALCCEILFLLFRRLRILAAALTIAGAIGFLFFGREKLVDLSVQQRLSLWHGTLMLISQKPLMGYGGGRFELLWQKVKDQKILLRDGDSLLADKPHNILLEVAVSFGLLGLFFFLWIFFYLLQRGWLVFQEKEDPFFLSLVGYAIYLFFHFFRPADLFLFAVLSGCFLFAVEKPFAKPGEPGRKWLSWSTALLCLLASFCLFQAQKNFEKAKNAYEEGKIKKSIEALAEAQRFLPGNPFFLKQKALLEAKVFVFSPLPQFAPPPEFKDALAIFPHRELYFWKAKVEGKRFETDKNPVHLIEALKASQRSVALSPYFARGRIESARLSLLLFARTKEKKWLQEGIKQLSIQFPQPLAKEASKLEKAIEGALRS